MRFLIGVVSNTLEIHFLSQNFNFQKIGKQQCYYPEILDLNYYYPENGKYFWFFIRVFVLLCMFVVLPSPRLAAFVLAECSRHMLVKFVGERSGQAALPLLFPLPFARKIRGSRPVAASGCLCCRALLAVAVFWCVVVPWGLRSRGSPPGAGKKHVFFFLICEE